MNAGELFKKAASVPDLIPCTPKGIMDLLAVQAQCSYVTVCVLV
jgi:5,10-methylene-tetrahydrofolate dehydrogenase/methenyl tetrahydrofolate cyclohydrolase